MARKRESSRGGRRPHLSLTDVEWAILGVVWGEGPCAAGTVQEGLQETHGWAYSTVKTTMDRMVAKGLLASRAVRNLNLYSAEISREEAKRGELQRVLRRAFDGALSPMIRFIVEDEGISEKELQELREIVNRGRGR